MRQNLLRFCSLGLLAIFMSIHRTGASLDEALSFVRKTDDTWSKEDLENVLRSNEQLFSCHDDLWRYRPFFD